MKNYQYVATSLLVFLSSCVSVLPSSGAISSSIELSSSSSTISASTSSIIQNQIIDVYNLNDFHGAVEHNSRNGELGIARIGGFFEAKKSINPSSIFLSSGDMWQGSADSNITQGRLVVDSMNAIGFSAMAIGNHEFDWYDTVIIENQQRMNFPLLGINVIDKRTNALASFVEPYTMVDVMGTKVGVIGTIGDTLETTILASAVMNYEFVPYTSLVINAAEMLREEGAKLVILINHNGTVEQGVLPYVDGVFNGHTHRTERNMIQNTPVYQASAYGRAIGHMRFQYNPLTSEVIFVPLQSGVYSYQDLVTLSQFPSPSTTIEAIYNQYLTSEINSVKNEVIGTADDFFSRSALGRFAVEEMLTFAKTINPDVIASVHNTGGVRAEIEAGEVTYGDLYRAFPFDNELVIVPVTGSQLNYWLTQSNHIRTIENMPSIVDSQTYYVVTINYLSEQHWENPSRYPHDIENAENTFAYIREVLKERWIRDKNINPGQFN
jgi:2',3'-cyclic-nucleotide 2'-phosphodiesterase/3'-nucleotidase